MTTFEPVAPLVGHRVTSADTLQPKRLRGVKSYASIIRPIASIADKLEQIYTAICPPLLQQDLSGGSTKIAGKIPQSLEYLSLQTRLQTAKQYEEWEEAALRLDEFEGHSAWKKEEESTDYDAQVLKQKIVEVDRIREGNNLKDMLMYIRTALHRDIAGIGNSHLYRQSRVGTKEIIEQYVAAAVALIEATIQSTATTSYPLPWTVDKMREMWLQTRQAFGRTALLLSGGGTLGMCHIGVVKALYEADALPRIISGASAGSIVAAVCCSKTQEEIPGLLQEFCYGELDVFFAKQEESQKYSNMAKHFLTQGNLYDIQNLNRVMKLYLGDMTFLEAYNRTNRILNICVSNEDPREQLTLLNYVTAPNVLVWSAVAASCSVPLIYSPAKLYEKHPRTGELTESSQSWIDGSMNGDIPMERLSELFDVNHFIVSQVNPHIIPFISKDDEVLSGGRGDMQDEAPAFKDVIFSMAKEELLFRLKMSAEFGLFPTASTRLRALISQTYQGDINIVPQVARAHYLRILSNPTPEFMIEACEAGEKATWPKINRIRTRCAIENAIERAVKEACDYAEFSASKVAFRRDVYKKSMSQAHLRSSLKRSGSRGGYFVSADTRMESSSGHGHRSTRSLHERAPVHWDDSSLKRPDSSHADGEESDSSDSTEDPDLSNQDKREQIFSDTELDSDMSSSSPPPPTKWYGKFAASRSQPVTPSIASRTFGVTPGAITPLSTMTPVANTSSKRQSSAEATYKRLFHGAKKHSVSSSRADEEAPPMPRKSSSKLKLNLQLKGSKITGSKRN
ncbi:hypothetical protein AMS68_003329 [Peltaster fructicola]|uniref:Patatin-like phospholipase domain-containing protein n=1 Tax=Peltaster fructicola TaxID=286661 RepID=A0A6H0XSR6_9PEZI|nr:hypothetical protein AMS68_003329 [Peltaster fructicola]